MSKGNRLAIPAVRQIMAKLAKGEKRVRRAGARSQEGQKAAWRKVGGSTAPLVGGQAVGAGLDNEAVRKSLSEVGGGRGKGL